MEVQPVLQICSVGHFECQSDVIDTDATVSAYQATANEKISHPIYRFGQGAVIEHSLSKGCFGEIVG
jgi:hypothetical protein